MVQKTNAGNKKTVDAEDPEKDIGIIMKSQHQLIQPMQEPGALDATQDTMTWRQSE